MSDLTAAVKSIDRLTRTTETIKCCYQGTNNVNNVSMKKARMAACVCCFVI